MTGTDRVRDAAIAAAADSARLRHTLTIDGRALSYLDFGGPGRPLLALHGGLSEGLIYADLAGRLGAEWRVIAPDQRGHGDSDRAAAYDRAGYLADLVALLGHLGLGPLPVLGHSLGALNAVHLAAERPDLVSALVNIDAGVLFPEDAPNPMGFLTGFPYTAATREELVAACGAWGPMVAPALRPLPDGTGWRLPFHPQDTLDTIAAARGDHWQAWLGSSCPALLVHGRRSDALTQELADAMATARPKTSYAGLDTGHVVPVEDPAGLAAAVGGFLNTL
ncbi:alpha/beta hydrolase [Streptomyces venezuelae]|uniref:Alpha/beta hydrolase n=1 Tax=Streptomyces venezuelae TaxID=54571 RepID=A0A5P2D760_STRVZ|nr:alpha/beta hydrolase [Streptomyces venezuelae]QES48969.1 alpha/beta hydrolase [Streptomyces venezuelae]